MKLTEQQLFDYIFCPAKFEMKYIKGIDIKEPVTLPRLLNKVSKFFYINLLNGKICSSNELKAKWDSICAANPNFIDPKKNLAGMGHIINLINWATRERIVILDVDTKYNLIVDDIELEGCMEPILAGPNNRMELLVTNFSDKMPDQIETDMRLKYTLDVMAFNNVYDKELDGIRIHSVKANSDLFSKRSYPEFRRLETTIKSVAKGIQHEIYYPRENPLCSTCQARDYCKYWYK